MVSKPLLLLLIPLLFVGTFAQNDFDDGFVTTDVEPIDDIVGSYVTAKVDKAKLKEDKKERKRKRQKNRNQDDIEDITKPDDYYKPGKGELMDGQDRNENTGDGHTYTEGGEQIEYNGKNEETYKGDETNKGEELGNAEGGNQGKLDEEANPELKSNFLGAWKIHSQNAGVCAMQLQLMPVRNKAVWYDTTELGPSGIGFNPPFCRASKKNPNVQDCFAHGVEYDTVSGNVRQLKFDVDPWCSSGGLSPNGALVSTGGDNAGFRAVRFLNNCDNCDVKEKPLGLASNRRYATQHILQDGRIALVGGRNAQNYEIISSNDQNLPIKHHALPLLIETSDEVENNLYPFVNLLPDGNLFVFANTKSIIVNPENGETVHTFPELQGGSRNYPASGMSAMLPLKLTPESTEDNVEAEVLVCGGNTKDAFKFSNVEPRQYYNAHKDCGRIKVTDKDSKWEKEDMPSGRVMGDMLLLPTGDILILNGAKKGTSGWHCADEPNFTPLLYKPDKENGERFTELQAATIPRMYHSASAVLPDGEILVAGSNANPNYDFNAAKFRTELRVEKFTPPYLAPELQKYRAEIQENQSDKALNYGKLFKVYIKLEGEVKKADIKITMLPPPFTTHGYSHAQRLIVLGLTEVKREVITAMAPPSGKIAPPGYYMLFVVHRGVPSKAMWVKL